MCILNKKTKEKITDCGYCGCGQSSNWGEHSNIGKDGKCGVCGLVVIGR